MELLEKSRMLPPAAPAAPGARLNPVRTGRRMRSRVLSPGWEGIITSRSESSREGAGQGWIFPRDSLGVGDAQGEHKDGTSRAGLGALDKPEGQPSRSSRSGKHRNMGVFPGKPGSIRELPSPLSSWGPESSQLTPAIPCLVFPSLPGSFRGGDLTEMLFHATLSQQI